MMVEWLDNASKPTYEFEYYRNLVRVFVSKFFLNQKTEWERGERMNEIMEWFGYEIWNILEGITRIVFDCLCIQVFTMKIETYVCYASLSVWIIFITAIKLNSKHKLNELHFRLLLFLWGFNVEIVPLFLIFMWNITISKWINR